MAEFVKTDEPPDNLDDLLKAARASLPPRVRAWIESLRASWRSGDVLFVHAGVNPQVELEAFLAVPWNVPLARLDEDRHWAWVRWPFLNHHPRKGGFSGCFVVHGHTPNDARRDPSHADQIAGFRLNLDAGSGMTGIAKMAIIRGRQAEVVTARGPTNRELMGDGEH
jgi:serine/threonine protein phosphatase 1